MLLDLEMIVHAALALVLVLVLWRLWGSRELPIFLHRATALREIHGPIVRLHTISPQGGMTHTHMLGVGGACAGGWVQA